MATICDLCGYAGWANQIRPGLVFYPNPVFPGRYYEAVKRCADRDGCAARAHMHSQATRKRVRKPMRRRVPQRNI